MKKESKNLKSITERNSKMTKVIDIDIFSNTKVIDFELAICNIARKLHLKICDMINKDLDKYSYLDKETFQQLLISMHKSLKIHCEINLNVSYYIPQ